MNNKRWRNAGLYVLLAVVAIALATTFLEKPAPAQKTLKYSQFIQEVKRGEIENVGLSADRSKAQIQAKDGTKAIVNLPPNDNQLVEILTKNVKGNIYVLPTSDESVWFRVLSSLFFPVLLLVGLFFLLRRAQSGPGNQAMNFGKSKARVQMEPQTQITFGDVAGIEQAKLELTEVVDFLKNADRFTALGAKIPKGVLLVGPPGTGKTLLARAVAGEAGVPFFSISGSEFVEMFVGVGASRVRDLFEQAKAQAPCIVFIDEIDAVGRQRGAGLGGGNDEREQTLNQLLTEMDGFEGNNGIIIIAATNRVDVLDSALLRPGRFDRQVQVDPPDYKGRLAILQVHAKNKKVDPAVSMEVVARRTTGFTGADLANLLNEAAIFTARRRKEAITIVEIDDAIDRVIAGMEGKVVLDGKFKRMTAYHEIGHALLMTLLKDHDPLQKVTVLPRGQAIGLTWGMPNEEHGLESRAKLKAMITVNLGGRAAEEIVFGKDEVDSGADSDIQTLTRIARAMVTRVGMSELGLVAMNTDQQEYSETIAAQIDREMRKIVKECHQQALDLLEEHRWLMDILVEVLIDKETIDGDEFRQIVDRETGRREVTRQKDSLLAGA